MREPRLYFDYASTTPLRKEVEEAMRPWFGEAFGNPGSLHSFGQEAIRAVDRSRDLIAKALGADFRQILFTSSATEANNLALQGVVRKYCRERGVWPRLIVSSIEHESVLEVARALGKQGADVIYLPVDAKGRVSLDALGKALSKNTALVSVMHGNNEVGTLQPIQEIGQVVRAFDKNILFHTDAAQSFAYVAASPGELGVDMMTISSHKLGGPKGAAALYVKDISKLEPILFGGGQEFGLRSGTENVPAIVGFSRAVELAVKERKSNYLHALTMSTKFFEALKRSARGEINGEDLHAPMRLPHILNVHFPGENSERLLTALDLAGLAASSGSACRARSLTPSYVLRAMGLSEDKAKESVRFSFGRETSEGDIDTGGKIIGQIVHG